MARHDNDTATSDESSSFYQLMTNSTCTRIILYYNYGVLLIACICMSHVSLSKIYQQEYMLLWAYVFLMIDWKKEIHWQANEVNDMDIGIYL